MKKLLFIAAVAAIALTSCEQEKNIDVKTVGDNEIGFSLQGAATRSAEVGSPVMQGNSVLLGKKDGFELYLEETIEDMYYSAPETRGTPVYTENVGFLYKDQLGVYAEVLGGVEATYSHLSQEKNNQGKTTGWIYQHRYSQDIWPDESTEVQFYLRMPTDMTSHGVTSVANAGGTTTVEYTSPITAAATEDIIFSGVKMSHNTYMGYYSSQGGAPVVLYHALTGVKFAIKNTDAELANIQINKISFIGLKNTGSFTFNAASPSATAFTWTATATADNVISQTYEAGDLVTYDATTHASNNFADSFYAAGTVNNLNKADASYTFWLIPQGSIQESDAVLKIEYTMNGVDQHMEINIKDLVTSNWQPGQIRTYTFKLNEVNLKIEDKVNLAGTDNDGHTGSIKNNVKITNTGNTRAFIRASIVGQWVNDVYKNGVLVESNPIFGFTDKVNQLYEVESWYNDQFVKTTAGTHGTFVGLAGYKGAANPLNNWTLCTDGYYYYTEPVDPDDLTDPLFTSYTVGIMPMPEIAGAEVDNANMHFELEIATQAIAANDLHGEATIAWDKAWENATGVKPVKK